MSEVTEITQEVRDLVDLEKLKALNTAIDFASSVQEVVVTTPAEAEGAIETVTTLKKWMDQIQADERTAKKPYEEPWDKINDVYKSTFKTLKALRYKVKSAVNDYHDEQERKRLEEQRKANEKAERERREKEEKARKQREEAEAAARAAQEAADEKEREKLEKEAARKEALAQANEAKAMEKVAPIIQSAAPKLRRGVSQAKYWTAEITDPVALKRHCLTKLVEVAYAYGDSKLGFDNAVAFALLLPESRIMDVSEANLKAIARSDKTAKEFPGARVFQGTK